MIGLTANRIKIKKQPQWIYDPWILWIALSLMAFGLLMVASASMVVSDREYNFPWHYIIKQAVYLGAGLVLGGVVTRIPVAFWKKFSLLFLFLSGLLLLLVLVPGIGRVVNGSRRWISLGFISLQGSEIVKLSAILYLANYLQKFQQQIKFEMIGFIKPLVILGVIVGLLLLEPDFGTSAVITITFLALLFIAGVRLQPFIILFIVVVVAMALLAILSPYRLLRLTTFIHPWQNAYGSGYQLTQSLIAFGRGGLWGVGLGNSIQKLFYLPEAHTDFIFAVIAEELGLIGELVLIALYLLFIMRTIKIGLLAESIGNLFSAYTAYGIGLWLGLQAMINMGVNAGILPTKGLTLPFISYGGSSTLVNCIVVGILLRISFETRREATENHLSRFHR